jgi:hypothetical protein
MPTNVTPYNIPVPDGTDPVNLAGTSGDLAAMATAVGTALDGKLPLNSTLYFPAMRSGNYYGMPASAATTSSVTLDRVNYYAVIVPNAVTVDRIGAEVTTAGGAGSVVRLGMYAHDYSTDLPGTLVIDAGTIDGTSTGFQEVTISQALDPGIYWVASVAQVGSAPIMRGFAGGAPSAPWLSRGTSTAGAGGANLQAHPREAGVSGALPGTANANATQNLNAIVQFRIA